MGELIDVPAAVFNDVDLVTVVNRLYRRESYAGFRPKSAQNDLLAAGFLDRRDKVLVVPSIHRRPLDGFLARKHRAELRPDVSAERFRFDSREHNRQSEHSRGFAQCYGIVDNRLTIEVAYPEEHLWLMIDQRHDAIVGGQEPLLR